MPPLLILQTRFQMFRSRNILLSPLVDDQLDAQTSPSSTPSASSFVTPSETASATPSATPSAFHLPRPLPDETLLQVPREDIEEV